MKKIFTMSNLILLLGIVIPFIVGKGLIYIPLLFILLIVEKIFKHNFDEFIKIIYYIYVFMAVYLGGCLKFYKNVNGFDTLVHTIAGFVLTLVGIFIFDRCKLKKNRYIYDILFMFVFSMACASLWEITEFSMDQFLNMNWQRRQTGVMDTMKDMCVHLAGSIFFIILYIVDKKVNNRKIFDKLLK